MRHFFVTFTARNTLNQILVSWKLVTKRVSIQNTTIWNNKQITLPPPPSPPVCPSARTYVRESCRITILIPPTKTILKIYAIILYRSDKHQTKDGQWNLMRIVVMFLNYSFLHQIMHTYKKLRTVIVWLIYFEWINKFCWYVFGTFFSHLFSQPHISA